LKRVYSLPEDFTDTQLIYFARILYPEYPGIIDLGAWEIGRARCKPKPAGSPWWRGRRLSTAFIFGE
jgi:hypothetical protein